MRVGEVLENDCAICTEEMPLDKVFELMLENNCDAIAVVESFAHKVPLGLITEREICLQLVKKHKDPRWLTAANVMNANVSKFKKTTNLDSCLNSMQKQNVEFSFVIDDKGMFCGTVKRKDLESATSEQRQKSPYSSRRRKSFVRASDTIF